MRVLFATLCRTVLVNGNELTGTIPSPLALLVDRLCVGSRFSDVVLSLSLSLSPSLSLSLSPSLPLSLSSSQYLSVRSTLLLCPICPSHTAHRMSTFCCFGRTTCLPCCVTACSFRLNFSCNLLSGAVPTALNSSQFYPAAFTWNCFDPAVLPSNPPALCPRPSNDSGGSHALSTKAVAAIVATVTATAIVASAVAVFVMRRRRQHQTNASDATRGLVVSASESTSLLAGAAHAGAGTVAIAGMELMPAVCSSSRRSAASANAKSKRRQDFF
jgi:hypothetical protein